MSWAEVDFGKYKDANKTLPEIVLIDTDYFVWGYEFGIFRSDQLLNTQSEDIYRKIQSIRIPFNDNNELICEFISHENKIQKLQVNFKDSPRDVNCVYRESHIDLTFPNKYNPESFNKMNQVLPQLYNILFGGETKIPNRTICDDFFIYEENFFM